LGGRCASGLRADSSLAFKRGNPEGALTHYRRAIKLKGDLADAYNNMGNALKELGRLSEAETAFLAAHERDPKLAGVYVNLADSRTLRDGDRELAALRAPLSSRSTAARSDAGVSMSSTSGLCSRRSPGDPPAPIDGSNPLPLVAINQRLSARVGSAASITNVFP
jgi:hypothetical protein